MPVVVERRTVLSVVEAAGGLVLAAAIVAWAVWPRRDGANEANA